MSLELLSKSDYNVISIDWMIGATPPYTQAVANARLVGAIVAHFLKSIQVIDDSFRQVNALKIGFDYRNNTRDIRLRESI